jgi:hypothetical protein
MAQQMSDNYATYDDSICLLWTQRSHSITVPLDQRSSGVGTIWTIPVYSRHQRYCERMAISQPERNIAMEVTLFDDNDGENNTKSDPTQQSQKDMYNERVRCSNQVNWNSPIFH